MGIDGGVKTAFGLFEERRVVLDPGLPGEGFFVRFYLSRRLGVPVFAGQGCLNMLYCTLSTGFGVRFFEPICRIFARAALRGCFGGAGAAELIFEQQAGITA